MNVLLSKLNQQLLRLAGKFFQTRHISITNYHQHGTLTEHISFSKDFLFQQVCEILHTFIIALIKCFLFLLPVMIGNTVSHLLNVFYHITLYQVLIIIVNNVILSYYCHII